MFTCSDCADINCTAFGSDQQACDEFTLDELPEENPLFPDRISENFMLMEGRIDAVNERITMLEEQFDAIIAAVVKAANETSL